MHLAQISDNGCPIFYNQIDRTKASTTNRDYKWGCKHLHAINRHLLFGVCVVPFIVGTAVALPLVAEQAVHNAKNRIIKINVRKLSVLRDGYHIYFNFIYNITSCKAIRIRCAPTPPTNWMPHAKMDDAADCPALFLGVVRRSPP